MGLVEIKVTLRPEQAERMMSILKKFQQEDVEQMRAEAGTFGPGDQQLEHRVETAQQTVVKAVQSPPEPPEAPEEPSAPAEPVQPQEDEPAEPAEPSEPKRPSGKATLHESQLQAMKLPALRRMAEMNGVDPKGKTKREIIEAIVQACSDPDATAEELTAEIAPTPAALAESNGQVEEDEDWGEDDVTHVPIQEPGEEALEDEDWDDDEDDEDWEDEDAA